MTMEKNGKQIDLCVLINMHHKQPRNNDEIKCRFSFFALQLNCNQRCRCAKHRIQKSRNFSSFQRLWKQQWSIKSSAINPFTLNWVSGMRATVSTVTTRVNAAMLAMMVNWKASIRLHSTVQPIHASPFHMINCIIIYRTGTTNHAWTYDAIFPISGVACTIATWLLNWSMQWWVINK